jgi:tripartite-type tricarboxylate transporter receptor subunit TctC
MNKLFHLLAPVAFLAVSINASAAESVKDYPSKPVRLVSGFAAGGPADIAARILAQGLQGELKQPFIVESRTGDTGNIATQNVVHSAPDGYSLLVATASLTINAITSITPGFDVNRDLMPVAMLATQANAIGVNSKFPIKNMAELETLFKKGGATFATAGSGTSSDLSAKFLFNMKWGSDAVAVPYRGAGPVGLAVAGGTPSIGFTTVTGLLPLQHDGRLKILAIVDNKRMTELPDVPTLAELGYKDMNPSWTALFAPAGTPKALIDKINAATKKVLMSPEYAEKLHQQYMTASSDMTPEQLTKYLADEYQNWGRIVKMTGATHE